MTCPLSHVGIMEIINMKSLKQLKEIHQVKPIHALSKLVEFIPENELKDFGLSIKEEFIGKHIHIEWTRENILKRLESVTASGFENALGHEKGFNKKEGDAFFLVAILHHWNWILEEGLEDFYDFPRFGLPMFKATAIKYGFNNPIGDDFGNELKYDFRIIVEDVNESIVVFRSDLNKADELYKQGNSLKYIESALENRIPLSWLQKII